MTALARASGCITMKIKLVATVGCALAFVAGLSANGLKSEKQQLQGVWEGVALEDQRYPALTEFFQDAVLVFKSERIEPQKEGGYPLRIPFRIDPKKRPKIMDWTISENKRTDRLKGIYKLNGDVLKICLAEPGKRRPSEFTAIKGRQFLIILKRKK